MSDDTLLSEWHARWEDHRAAGGNLDLDEFVRRHCAGPPALVERFRKQVRQLSSADRAIRRAAPAAAPRYAERAGERPSPGAEPLAGYRLERWLGEGGFGQVWRAVGPGGHPVAVKLVPLDGRVGEVELRSLDVIRGVRHPNIVTVFASARWGRWLVVVMELADRSLDKRLEECRAAGNVGIPRSEAVGYLIDAARGLDFLNGVRRPGVAPAPAVQHRDVKPQNLLLVGGGVKVADFGLVKELSGSQGSHTGAMSVHYAPPEFFKGTTAGTSDQYSLAVTYCCLRGGRLPFEGTQEQVVHGHLFRTPDLTMLPAAERPAVARAMAKDPSERWPTCDEFAAAVAAASAGAETAVPTDTGRSPHPARTAPRTARPTRSQTPPADPQPDAPLSTPAEAKRRAVGSRRRKWVRRGLVVFGFVVAGVVAFVTAAPSLRTGGLPSAFSSLGRESSGVERGFGDTVLRYRDRSYDGAKWTVAAEGVSLTIPAGLRVGATPELHRVTGWDADDFWVSAGYRGDDYPGILMRFREGKWTCAARVNRAAGEHVLRLTERDEAVFSGEWSARGGIWFVRPSGALRLVDLDTSFYRFYEAAVPVAPGTTYFLGQHCPVTRVTAERVEWATAPDEKFLNKGGGPDADRPLGFLRHGRAPAPGEAYAAFLQPYRSDTRLGKYQDGRWVDCGQLSDDEVNDVWVGGTNGSRFVMAAGAKGKVWFKPASGNLVDRAIPAPLELFRVWGVSSDKFWVLDVTGGVWERSQVGWRQVVTGQGTKVGYRDAWVSPEGKVYATTGRALLKLD